MRMVIGNVVVVTDPLAGKFLPGHAVAIEDGTIAAVGPADELRAQYPGAARLDGGGSLLLPGLIDAHTHLYAALSAGMPAPHDPPRDFPQVLERIWWRFDKALRDDDIQLSALVGSIFSVRQGITTVVDHHASPFAVPDSLSRLAAGVSQVGLRACLSYEVSDRDGPVRRDQGIAENQRFIREARAGKDPLLRGLFGMHAVFTLSDETLRRCSEAAAALGVGCHMHVAEHAPEVYRFAQSHDCTIIGFLNDLGILGPHTVLAHTVHLDRRDREIVKDTGSFSVHNPRSNMGNGVGIAPIIDMLDMGQPVGLGSDGFFDIPDEIVFAAVLQTLGRGDPGAFSVQQALRLVYDHNARLAERIFGCKLGRVAPGYAADLILVAYDPATPMEEWNLVDHVVSALRSGGVHAVLVNGRLVMEHGQVQGIDEAQVLQQARVQAAQIWARL